MRILFVNAYFSPEKIAFSHLEKDLIEGFVAAGHEIEVICPTPTRGVTKEVRKQYKRIKKEELYEGKVRVRRFAAPKEGRNPLLRAFRYFWCNFREYRIGRKYKNIDVVFAVSTPPTQGILAGKLGKKLKCPFVYSLQDIFPDSLVTTGLTKKGSLIWKLGRKIERKTYARANRIIVIAKSHKQNLLEKGVPEEKISIISNWVDLEKIKPIARAENKLFEDLPLDKDKFLVVYAGNFGAAQGADILLKAAEKLLGEEKIQFVVFGGGAEFESAVEYARARELTNVIINPLLPQERVAEVYSLGDVALITCKAGVGNSGMPSKTWSIMACNTPIIASFDLESDMADVLQASGAGRCVEAENVDALVEAILTACEKKAEKCDLRGYVKEQADKEACVARYLKTIFTNDNDD